jgi:BirA family transcriptional regulator, biotin operon repressor / biotin---[acetyl-CoA-carboxylase] ligase
MYRLRLSIFAKNSNSLPPVNRIGTPFIQLNQVDSTNNYAMGQVQAHLAEHGATYFTWHQTVGRGQRGKTWKTAAGQNLTMSIVVEPWCLGIAKQFYLSMAVALACADLINRIAVSDTTIKWPNDIYWKDRKAGGILIENILQGNEWKYSIIGVGLNINETNFDPELTNAVSLKQITGKQFDLLKIATELCGLLQYRWDQLVQQQFSSVLDEYNQWLFRRGEIVRLQMGSAVLEARVISVQETGELMIDTGTITAVPFGAVSWLL